MIKGKRDIGLGDLSLNGESDGPAPPAELVDTVATAFVASVRDLDNQNFTFHELIDYYRLPWSWTLLKDFSWECYSAASKWLRPRSRLYLVRITHFFDTVKLQYILFKIYIYFLRVFFFFFRSGEGKGGNARACFRRRPSHVTRSGIVSSSSYNLCSYPPSSYNLCSYPFSSFFAMMRHYHYCTRVYVSLNRF